jgi:hypothetical protein
MRRTPASMVLVGAIALAGAACGTAASGNGTAENAATERATPEQATLEKAATERATPEQATLKKAATGKATGGEPSRQLEVPPLSEEVVDELAKDGFLLDDYDSDGKSWVRVSRARRVNTNAAVEAPLDQEAAIAAAEKAIGLPADAVVAASLAALTTPEVGFEQQPDPNLPSDIDPLYVDASTWAVEFVAVEFPVLGPPGSGGGTYETSCVVFVDAYDGSLMISTDLSP